MVSNLHPDEIAALVYGNHGAPFNILGPHASKDGEVIVRTFRPTAQTIDVIDDSTGKRYPMERIHKEGLFEATVTGKWPGLRYHYAITTTDDRSETVADPYAFPAYLTEYDLYLLGEGRHWTSYEKLGAHICEIDGVKGVNFAVWAPNAFRVSVIGMFNGWDPRIHPMRHHETNGFWEIFIPDIGEGEIYRFDIRSRYRGYHVQKTDPYGFYAEKRPQNASIVANIEGYEWNDQAWMDERANHNPLTSPVSIYEVHLGSWKTHENGSWLSYREAAHELVNYVKEMGYTHIELLPVAEHPLDASWGYQVTGYYAATSRFGHPKEFMYFVDYCHQHNIGVILDWVPAHFPKDWHGLGYFDGTQLYEHADPRQAEHPDWGTYIFNYGRNEVRNFLIANALFWVKKYHIDGLRVDAVSSMLYLDFSRKAGEWVPNEYGGNENLPAIDFIKEANQVIHQEAPGVMTIAEESTAWPMVSRPTYVGGLGFTMKWNMGWMHDTLQYVSKDPVYRHYHHNLITFSMIYAFNENFVLSLSHDEVVHGKGSLIEKMPGDWWQKFASLRLLFGYQYTHPGKKLNFMGQEFAQWREWSETRGLDWNLLEWPMQTKMQNWVRDLNHLYKQQPALFEHDFDAQGFQWIEANDNMQSSLAYVRFADNIDDFVVVACNFTPVPREKYRLGVPKAGYYRELLNSDAEVYGGGNVGNGGGVNSDPIPWGPFPHSVEMVLPPLAIVILKMQ